MKKITSKKKIKAKRVKPSIKKRTTSKKKFNKIRTPFRVGGQRDFTSTLTLIIKNTTDEKQQVNAFSLTETLPQGVTISLLESDYNFLLKMLPANPHFATGFRLSSDNIFNAINGIVMRKQNTTGQIASYPIFPFGYFSPYQFQANKMDCSPINMSITGGTEMRFLVEPKSELCCTLLCTNKYKNLEEYVTAMKNNKMDGSFQKTIPIIVENETDENQQVSLFDLKDTESLDKLPVKISTVWGYGSYLEILKSLEAGWKIMEGIGALRMYCTNPTQSASPLFSDDWDKEKGLMVANYLSPYQYQLDVIDCHPFNYKWNQNNPIKFSIAPKTKVVLFFFEMGKTMLNQHNSFNKSKTSRVKSVKA